ncbi:hypothetical protein NUH88_02390 [Nisaea acidiphila]|uniref:Uncharacterized protein n=1 Tax=Nisaea acidiphila TaxID=1862145 RepID=A0A9J7AYP0_9PROT|nr:hypothetical protein [Nisaea acidiphila]UUX50549.1 hypothetical protein NUH88_02390 [Nisaea acidiphila]
MVMAPHGNRAIWTDGRILMSRNTGPFNLEALILSTERTREERIRLTESGPWGSVAIIDGSVMFTAEALDMIRQNMRDPERNGNLVASAFVVSPETEGYHLCEAILGPVYALAGAAFRIFEDVDTARMWVAAKIDAAANGEVGDCA